MKWLRQTLAGYSGLWGIIGANKLLIGLAILAAGLFEYNPRHETGILLLAGDNCAKAMVRRLVPWDAGLYLKISQTGYEPNSPLCAFYPLWPALNSFHWFVWPEQQALASFLLANALSLMMIRLLYLVALRKLEPGCARKTLILFLAFPGALFFSFPYTESLFLGLVLVFFWKLEEQHYPWAGAAAFLLPLTKAIGIFILFPLAWHIYENKKPPKYWLLLFAPWAGYLTYFLVMQGFTGNAFSGFEAQQAFIGKPSVGRIFMPWEFWLALKNIQSFGGMQEGGLDRGLFVLFLAVLPLVYRLDRAWFWYALPTGLVPAMSCGFMSYRRFIMMCFPVFIALGSTLSRPGRKWLFWYYILLLWGVQLWSVVQFVNVGWAG